MTIIDTHSHIYSEDFDADIDEVIGRAKSSGVDNILLPNIDISSIERLNQLSDKYFGYCLPMMGLHPTSVTKNWESDLYIIKKEFCNRRYIAVGEIGIDLYWDKSLEKEQKAAFEEQLRWSIELDLPVSIHCRNAINETLECIKNIGAEKLRGVFHSFSGTDDDLYNVLELKKFYLGINGTITYKNSTLPSVLRNTDLDRIIVETDAPYLPPAPYRGKRNEPLYTTHIVQRLSEIYNLSVEEVCLITTKNAKDLYCI